MTVKYNQPDSELSFNLSHYSVLFQESEEDLESSEEELDLTKKCHPIGYYLNDRAEMINQMFSVIKGNKLRAMLPPILKV